MLMPWEITLRRTKVEPRLDKLTVQSEIQSLMPGIEFSTEPSGLQKIEAAEKMGIKFPESMVQYLEAMPEKLYAFYSEEGLSITLYGFESKPLIQLHSEIRGTQNPATILRRICSSNAWEVFDDSTGKRVNLEDTEPVQWLAFKNYQETSLSEGAN